MSDHLPRNWMSLLWWLRRVLFLWVRTKVVPANPTEELSLKPNVPVCYVLSYRSISDLLVLDQMCRRFGLPLPVHKAGDLKSPGTASFVYLQKMGLLQPERDSKAPPSPLLRLAENAATDKSMEVQIVPVSVFWGRNPGREERSILKLLFFDDEHAGIVQKIFIVLAQGRQSFLNFGRPVSLRNLVDEGASPPETAKKLRRVLRVHFRRQRTAAMGPSLPSRASVIAHLVHERPLREAILEEARKKKLPVEKAEQRARRYLLEIISDQKYAMVRLADIFLTWLWNRLFGGVVIKHSHRLREIEQSHEVVYLPSHRSHMDYLLLSYSLYYEGVPPPHIMAGINLNFWPVGPLLRRCGAFYARRTFGGNRLYTAAFNEYVHYLHSKGYAIKFYPEGGRSRTGRLLSPKTGMLAMVVQSYLRNPERPIAFIPIYLGYDKVMEVRTYQTELQGKAKRSESVGQLVKARKALKMNFGQAYIGFGEPIYLKDALDSHYPAWREERGDSEQKPKWFAGLIQNLAQETMVRINSTAVVSPLAMFSLVILSSPTRALGEEDLLYLMDKLTSAMRASPYAADVVLPPGSAREHLQAAIAVAKVERFQHPGGDVIFMEERESVLLTYYRNNILHLVALPSLVASFFQHNERVEEEALESGAELFYPFLKQDFFLRWDAAHGRNAIRAVVASLVKEGLLFREGNMLRRPEVTSRDLTTLLILARSLGQTLERYAISNALLARQEAGIERKAFEAQCTLMAQRIAILNGVKEPEFFDKNLFKNYLDRLVDLGYVTSGADGRLQNSPGLAALADYSLGLLSGDIRQSIQRIGVSSKQGHGIGTLG